MDSTRSSFREIRTVILLYLLGLFASLFLLPSGIFAATPEHQQALERVNYYRQQAGLFPVSLDEQLSLGAQAHAHYLLVNRGDATTAGLGAHNEYSEKPGYTPEGAVAGRGSVIVMAANSLEQAVDVWMGSVYHRIPILNPRLTRIGLGFEGGISVMDVGSGIDYSLPTKDIVVYPGPDQTEIPLFFFEGEIPDPLPGAKYPVGYPITATFGGNNLQLSEVTLRDSSNGIVDSYLLVPEYSPYLRSSVAILGKQPLIMGRKYTISIAGTLDGTPFSKTWSFSVRGGIVAKVINQEGQPLTSIQAETWDPVRNLYFTGGTDSQGQLGIVLSPGVWQVRYFQVMSPTIYASQTQILEVKSGQITVAPTVVMSPVVKASGSLSLVGEVYGRLVGGRSRGRVRRAFARIGNSVATVNRRGYFRFTRVYPGVCTIFYGAPGYKSQTQIVEVKAGQVTRPPTVIMSR